MLSYDFDDPLLSYAFPMALGDTLHDDFCYWSDGLGIQYHCSGDSYITFDAEGTLDLPYGSYTGALHLTQWSSSVETTGGGTDTTYAMRHLWYLPGITQPILYAGLFIDSAGDLYPSGRLMEASSVTALQEHAGRATWQLAPNPAQDAVFLRQLPPDVTRVELLAADGRLLHKVPLTTGDTQVIALNDLPDGLYLVRVTGPGGISMQRLVKAR